MSTVNVLITCVGGIFSLETIRALRLDTDLNVRVVGVDAVPCVPLERVVLGIKTAYTATLAKIKQ